MIAIIGYLDCSHFPASSLEKHWSWSPCRFHRIPKRALHYPRHKIISRRNLLLRQFNHLTKTLSPLLLRPHLQHIEPIIQNPAMDHRYPRLWLAHLRLGRNCLAVPWYSR